MNKKLAASVQLRFSKVAGAEIHSTNILLAYREDETIKLEEFPNTIEGIENAIRFLKKSRITVVGMESTGCFYQGLYFALKQAGIKTYVYNPAQARGFKVHKTDKRDAEWLLKITEAQIINGSYIPEDDVFVLHVLTRRRMWPANVLAAFKKVLYSMLRMLGIDIKSVTGSLRSKRTIELLDKMVRNQLDKVPNDKVWQLMKMLRNLDPYLLSLIRLFIRLIKALETALKRLDQIIQEMLKPYMDIIDILMSVPGRF